MLRHRVAARIQEKARVNLILMSELVTRARAIEDNLSSLLDRLLSEWLATQEGKSPSTI